MSQITTYAIRKSYVRFQCPKCREWLNTNLADAGDQDTCPCCATAFIAPGVKERLESERLQREKAEQVAAATEAKRQKVLERSEAKRQRLQEQLEADIRIDQVRAQVAEQERSERARRATVTAATSRPFWTTNTVLIAVAVAFAAWFSLGVIVVQPIGALPRGATVVYFRLGLNLPFISSPDGLLLKSGREVSLLGRAAALAATASVIKERRIISLPYSQALYIWSTGGRQYER